MTIMCGTGGTDTYKYAPSFRTQTSRLTLCPSWLIYVVYIIIFPINILIPDSGGTDFDPADSRTAIPHHSIPICFQTGNSGFSFSPFPIFRCIVRAIIREVAG